MKNFFSICLILAIAAPAMAEDRAPQLPNIDAGSIINQINNQHNPFPQPAPTTLDYCVFTEFKNNKCLFKCESGVTLTEPAVKPDFSTGEPAGACATHIIRPVKPAFRGSAAMEQTFTSYGSYPTAQKASEVMNWALNNLKFAKAEVTDQAIVPNGTSDYKFRITFRAEEELAIEPGPAFKSEQDAYERMFDMADRLESDGSTVVIHEVVNYGADGYAYILGYFPGSGEDEVR